MTSVQAKLPFQIRKKISFYKTKENSQEDFTNATLRSTPTTKYTPTVKKLMTISSSESSDSESDAENIETRQKNKTAGKKKIVSTPRRRRASASSEEQGLTPPKQKKILSPTTPSHLLDRLNLESTEEASPSKPSGKDHLTPKRLFPVSSKYQNARKALHSSAPESLPGREKELAELEEFIKDHLKENKSGSLYVSGPPGTGKTASLSKIMLKPELKSAFKTVYVNCTTMKSAGTIYGKIIQELGIDMPKSGKNNKAVIEKHLICSHKMILLVLDEIDQLESKRQSVLYSIFEWPSIPKSKILLVGIANALDLTDRILPRLQARCELKPKLMHFAPYTKGQIVEIISERLKEAGVEEIFTGMAMQMLAGKVAAISGDVRRALDISRRVVELAESQKSQVLQPAVDNQNNGGSPKKVMPAVEKPVDLKEVVTVLNGVYGGSQNIEKEEDTFPLQQKLLLCSLMLILNKGRNKDVTVGKLHEVYKKVCKKRNILAVDISEFVGVCSLIETRGILRITGKKEPRLCKVNLQWDQEEFGAALQDKNMMADIINDTSCL
ncbi:cell division control protein 6 homolog [Fopius arisanus]|uniref:Cell division control protein n=2 Tax=Fopius arisanus TaxID=64838 RepID=A0A9R1TVI6_9HYME|nr:PREDICTED: cell division control protein 6 homolog [Fopius arisanus]